MKQYKFTKSNKYVEKARRLIPSQTQTLSKGHTQFPEGASPLFLVKGKGSHVWDVDGNEYVDFALALGPVTLGYNYGAVNRAIKKQLKDGITFSLPHPLEIELSESLTKIIPCAELVRFGKNGSDVTSAAIRIARAYTGRDKIAFCGYHGTQDWYICTTNLNKGIPKIFNKLVFEFEYNNIKSLEEIFKKNKDQIAAVIMEPISIVEPKNNFLHKVKETTHKNGAVLIFDEIVTGFRMSLEGAQGFYGITPDLATFGKGMANGMPISALVGNRKIMKVCEKTFFSMTFGGECLSIAAAIATIKEMKRKNVIKHIWKMGKIFQDGYNKAAKKHGLEKITKCEGLPCHNVITFDYKNEKNSLLLKSILIQECVKRGFLISCSQNFCYSHTKKEMRDAVKALDEALEVIKKAINSKNPAQYLKGVSVSPIFRKV